MGEAKRKREKMRSDLLQELDRWSRPNSASEERIASALAGLPVLQLERQPKHVLEYMRMKPRQCHLNCDEYRRLDPDGKSETVTGWRPINGVYVLHSVVKREGVLSCITPAPFESHNMIDFVVDESVQKITGENGKYVFTREGDVIEYGVRSDPEKVIDISAKMRARLEQGASPYTVMEEAFDLWGV